MANIRFILEWLLKVGGNFTLATCSIVQTNMWICETKSASCKKGTKNIVHVFSKFNFMEQCNESVYWTHIIGFLWQQESLYGARPLSKKGKWYMIDSNNFYQHLNMYCKRSGSDCVNDAVTIFECSWTLSPPISQLHSHHPCTFK